MPKPPDDDVYARKGGAFDVPDDEPAEEPSTPVTDERRGGDRRGPLSYQSLPAPPLTEKLRATLEKLRSLITVDEAADAARINRKTLYDMIARGLVPGVLRFNNVIRISRAVFIDWVMGREVEGPGEPEQGE
jgi:hypothetical protein